MKGRSVVCLGVEEQHWLWSSLTPGSSSWQGEDPALVPGHHQPRSLPRDALASLGQSCGNRGGPGQGLGCGEWDPGKPPELDGAGVSRELRGVWMGGLGAPSQLFSAPTTRNHFPDLFGPNDSVHLPTPILPPTRGPRVTLPSQPSLTRLCSLGPAYLSLSVASPSPSPLLPKPLPLPTKLPLLQLELPCPRFFSPAHRQTVALGS